MSVSIVVTPALTCTQQVLSDMLGSPNKGGDLCLLIFFGPSMPFCQTLRKENKKINMLLRREGSQAC